MIIASCPLIKISGTTKTFASWSFLSYFYYLFSNLMFSNPFLTSIHITLTKLVMHTKKYVSAVQLSNMLKFDNGMKLY